MHHPPRIAVVALACLALTACGFAPPAAAVPTAVPVPSATPALRPPRPTATLGPPTATPAPPGATPGQPTPTSGGFSTARPTRPPTPAAPVATLEPSPTLAPLAAEQRDQIFREVWETVRDHYLYEDYRGVDWQAARAEYAPKVAAAGSPEVFYGLMRDLIDRLGDDHSRFESPQEVADQEAEFAGKLRYGGIGAEVRTVGDGGLVSSVVPGGPADKAGIRPRDLIIAVEGIPFIKSEAFGPDGPLGRVRGEPGTSVVLSVRSPGQSPRDVPVVREAIDMDAFNRVTAQRIGGGAIGLVTIPSFYVEEVDTHVRAAVEGLLSDGPLKGLVIDVRSNSGGFVHLMRNTIALFHSGGSIGSTSGRSDREDQRIPEGRAIAGLEGVPIAVLTGPDTVSAAEMFAAGMQVLGRARVVGLPSAGNTENLYSYSFDDGSRLLLAEAAYRRPDGSLIEGLGVIPDRTVDAEWWRYAPDNDPQMVAAIEEIRAH